MPRANRNILVYMFTDARARRLFGTGWAAEAKRMVDQFRASHDLWAQDAAFLALHARLCNGSSEFPAWWRSHDVRATVAGRKTLHHETMGRVRADYATFQSNDDPTLKLVVYKLEPSP